MEDLRDVERAALDALGKLQGRSVGTAAKMFGLDTLNPPSIIKEALGLPLMDRLTDAGVRIHTVPVRAGDLYPWQAVSFPQMVLREFATETWETSELRNYLKRVLFLPILSDHTDTAAPSRTFGKPFFWSPDPEQSNGIRNEWTMFQGAVKEGKAAYREVPGKKSRENDLPGMTDTVYIHMRPKAQDKTDTDEDPKGNQVTKQAFWLNKALVQQLLAASQKDLVEHLERLSVPAAAPAVVKSGPLPHGNLTTILRALRRESRTSVIASGELPPLNEALYIRDWVDEAVNSFLGRSKARLLVLTGSAGHGKSAAIAMAKQSAKNWKVQPHIRPDASHADRPDEDYRAGLRRFLKDWKSSEPGSKHIVGINLGKALDFFSRSDDAAAFPELAAAFDAEFRLGLTSEPKPSSDIEIVDISHRIQPTLTERGLDLPWVRNFMARLDPTSPDSIVREAFEHQQRQAVGRHDPMVANVRLLATPEIRDHLLRALASAVVRHEVHLTPRRVMDFFSRLLLPEAAERLVDEEGNWLAAAIPELADAGHWGTRLNASLFEQLFPTHLGAANYERTLAAALRRENPTYQRSQFIDQKILRWASDPGTLRRDIPEWFLDYLGWKGERVGDSGRRLLIQIAGWTLPDAPASPRVARVEDFIRLCGGDEQTRQNFLPVLKAGLRQYVTRSFFREWDIDTKPQTIAVQVYRFSFNSRLTTELGEFSVNILEPQRSRWLRLEFNVEIRRGAEAPIRLAVDWPTFELLVDVASGYNPASGESGSTVTLGRLQRALQGVSNLEHYLEWQGSEDEPGRLVMHREGGANRAKVRTEVRA